MGKVVKSLGATFKPHAVCLADACFWGSTQVQDALGAARDAAKSHVRTTGHDVAVDVVRRDIYEMED